MFDVVNWVAHINEENGPRKSPTDKPFSVEPLGEMKIHWTTYLHGWRTLLPTWTGGKILVC